MAPGGVSGNDSSAGSVYVRFEITVEGEPESFGGALSASQFMPRTSFLTYGAPDARFICPLNVWRRSMNLKLTIDPSEGFVNDRGPANCASLERRCNRQEGA